MTEDQSDLDLAKVLGEIRAAVAENTASGVYSESLEAELQSHFARLVERSGRADLFHAAWAAVDELDVMRGLAAPEVSTSSRVPGGEMVHKAARRVVGRQLTGLTEHSQIFHEAVVATLKSVLALVESFASASPPGFLDLLHEVDTLQDRTTRLERDLGRVEPDFGVAPAPDATEERARRSPHQPAPYSTLAFDDRARGDTATIRAEYEGLADGLAGVPGPVLDIGAGRGELVQLLDERGVRAWGVEVDDELVAAGIAQGIDLRLEGGLEALQSAGAASLGAVTLIHVIEHLAPDELLEILAQAYEKLAPGGKLVLETPNPQSLYIYARAFWLDPSHHRPIHPIFLDFVLRSAGFHHIEFDWTALPADDERMVEIPGGDDTTRAINENFRRLNDIVFAAQNYRVIATR